MKVRKPKIWREMTVPMGKYSIKYRFSSLRSSSTKLMHLLSHVKMSFAEINTYTCHMEIFFNVLESV